MRPFLLLFVLLAVGIGFLIMRNMTAAATPTLPELKDLSGKTFNPENLKGKVYVLSYFQTWCSDCVKEQPQLQLLKEHFGDEIEILLVSDEDVNKLKLFKEKFPSALNIYQSSKGLKKDLGVSAFPTTYLISKEGKVLVKKVEGINWYTNEIIDMVEGGLGKRN